MPRHRGQNSTGGSRARLTNPMPEGRPAPFEPPANVLALLRGIWAKRQHLNDRERSIIHGALQRLQTGSISPAQLDAAKAIGKSLGVGFDDPPAPAVNEKVHPWGPLPLKPPGRV